MEIVGHAHVLEKVTSNVKVQLTISLTSIYEEIDWKYGLCIGSEETRRNEGEVGVCRNRFLDPVKSVLSGHSEVIFAGAELVTERSKL